MRGLIRIWILLANCPESSGILDLSWLSPTQSCGFDEFTNSIRISAQPRLLKTMMEKAKNGDLLGRKLVAMAQEKANKIKTLVANATPIIMEVVTEGVNRDRDGRVAAKNAVERLGSEIDGLIGAAQQTIAASPALTGMIDRMKQIDRVETGAERQVAAIVDVLPSIEEPQPETPE
jgi:hypothetical protein